MSIFWLVFNCWSSNTTAAIVFFTISYWIFFHQCSFLLHILTFWYSIISFSDFYPFFVERQWLLSLLSSLLILASLIHMYFFFFWKNFSYILIIFSFKGGMFSPSTKLNFTPGLVGGWFDALVDTNSLNKSFKYY